MWSIYFSLPNDQDWDPDFWQRIGDGPEWDRIDEAFSRAGAVVEDDERIMITCDFANVTKVRKIVDAARRGDFGPDVKLYWSSTVETTYEEE